jgi:hypothetical protein
VIIAFRFDSRRARRYSEKPFRIDRVESTVRNFIHAMSSPTVRTFQPGMVGISIARLPQHADGNAPVRYFTCPAGLVFLDGHVFLAIQPHRAPVPTLTAGMTFSPSMLPPQSEPRRKSRGSENGGCICPALLGQGES